VTDDNERGDLEATIEEIRTLRDAVKVAQEREKALSDAIKAWIRRHPNDDDLEDGEHGLHAYLQPQHHWVYDPPTAIHSRDKSLYERLSELGCFALITDGKMVEQVIKDGLLNAADMSGHRSWQIRAEALRIEPTDIPARRAR